MENTYPFVGVMEVAAIMLRQQQEQIDKLTAIVALREMDIAALKKEIALWKLSKSTADIEAIPPAKYSDAWWKEVAEFNKQLKEQNEQ